MTSAAVRVLLASVMAVSLVACGGGGTGSIEPISYGLTDDNGTGGRGIVTEDTDLGSEEDGDLSQPITIAGAGVKGPIAYGEVALYQLDVSQPGLYDVSNPVGTGSTDANAAISGLTVSSGLRPPFVLVINGERGVDLTTNKPPVIKQLVNVVTAEHLAQRRAIYATPFTTMAFRMAQRTQPESNSAFLAALRSAADELRTKLGFGMSSEIDLLNDPPIMTASAVGRAQQQLVVEHRAALEALAAVTNRMATPVGRGLKGEYFNNVDLTDLALVRTDATIAFNWGALAPDPSMGADTFSVRWTGYIQPKYSERYTFHTVSDDGVRVWIGDVLVIDNWTKHSVVEDTGSVDLTADNFYPIRVEYYDDSWGSSMALMWSSASQSKEDISSVRLFPDDVATLRNLDTDAVLAKLADDLGSDGKVDGAENGQPLTEIDLAVLNADPNTLEIPNTGRTVAEVAIVVQQELEGLGTALEFDPSVTHVELQPVVPDSGESGGAVSDPESSTSTTSTSSTTSTTASTTTSTSSTTASTTSTTASTTTASASSTTASTSSTTVGTSSTTASTSSTTASTSSTTVSTTTASTSSTTVSTTVPSTTTTTIGVPGGGSSAKYNPGHYMLIWHDSVVSREAEAIDLANSVMKGVQIRYLWRTLETSKGVYDFAKMVSDLAYLQSIGKRLVIQIDAIDWGGTAFGFPSYLATPEYNGGYFRRTNGVAIPKKYNPKLSARVQALIAALGAHFDREPFVEAIVIGETSLGVRQAQDASTVADYTVAGWKQEIKAVMSAAKTAFPGTTVIQYVNHLDKASEDLGEIVDYAKAKGVGIGGPDIRPYNATGMEVYYKYYPQAAGTVPLGSAVQWDNYTQNNPRTGKQVTARDILDFGVKELHLNYFFWLIRSPYFQRDVVPLLQSTGGPINE